MRRNIKFVCKFLLLASVTSFITALLFRLIKTSLPPIHSAERESYARFLTALDRMQDNTKIDWHDYAAISSDSQRIGKGEQGKPAFLSEDERKDYDSLFRANGFNAALSDKIALNRSLPDIRHKGCKQKKYLKNLHTVSVVIPFHNEHFSTLLRTVYSVINRSPAQLLKQIILVDDDSNKGFLQRKLHDYVRKNFKIVQLIRLPYRMGLIRARLAGAKEAIGDVLIFLDSHTEANVNWLPPLLEPIVEDYKTCVCPFIDVVQYETFEYRAQDEGARGAFDWELFYKRLPLLPEDLERPTEPFKSPVMAGGLFAISRKFFWELGGYDEGLDIWGGEQYELSFKIWQCGGQMVDAPCSRVGHIYRKYAPFPNPGRGDFVGKNYRRVAEVWMDEYAQYLYNRRPHYKKIDPGDLTKQKALREKLKCKPFKWFMSEVAFDLPLKYPPVEPQPFGEGEIRNIAVPEFCANNDHLQRDGLVTIKECVKGTANNGEQNFTLTWHKDIRPKGKTLCWDVSDLGEKSKVILYPCHGMKGNQYWKYDIEKQWFIHGGNPRCLDCDPGKKTLFVTKCDEFSKTQKWRFENVNLKLLADWDTSSI